MENTIKSGKLQEKKKSPKSSKVIAPKSCAPSWGRVLVMVKWSRNTLCITAKCYNHRWGVILTSSITAIQ